MRCAGSWGSPSLQHPPGQGTVLPGQHLPLVEVSITPGGGGIKASVTRIPMGLSSDRTAARWRSYPNPLADPGASAECWQRPVFFRHLFIPCCCCARVTLKSFVSWGCSEIRNSGSEGMKAELFFFHFSPCHPLFIRHYCLFQTLIPRHEKPLANTCLKPLSVCVLWQQNKWEAPHQEG